MRANKMITWASVILGLFLSFNLSATDGFSILSKLTIERNQNFTKAIQNANLDKFRLYDRRSILIIDGVQIELLSVVECKKQNIQLLTESYRDGSIIYKGSVLSLHSSGIITEQLTIKSNK